MRRRALFVAVTVGALGVGGAFAWLATRPDRSVPLAMAPATMNVEAVVPEATPQATPVMFGLQVGKMSLTEAKAWLETKGIACVDASPATIGARMAAARKAKGGPDAVTSASGKKRKPNPQVRLSCEQVASKTLGDRARTDYRGRFLLVFDAADKPLKHVSFQRSHRDQAIAKADVAETLAAMEGVGGQLVDANVKPLPAEFVYLAPFARNWKAGPAKLRLSALNMGNRGIVVSEEIGLSSTRLSRAVEGLLRN